MPTQTTLPADVVPFGSAVTIPNRHWRDERVELMDYDGDLSPGQSQVVVQFDSSDGRLPIAVKSVGTTRHVGDTDGDGENESLVKYHYEYRHKPADSWAELPGLSSPLPWGALNDPQPIIDENFVGPASSFRIRIENTTAGAENEFIIDENRLGGIITGVLMDGERVGTTEERYRNGNGNGGNG